MHKDGKIKSQSQLRDYTYICSKKYEVSAMYSLTKIDHN